MPAASSFRVLVIDDAASMRNIVMGCFEALGFRDMIQASDGEGGWNELQNAMLVGKPITLIACDWNMPKMPGIALLKRVRAHPELKNTPFLMITAETARDHVMEALNAGVTNYIVKPFTPAVLQEKLKKTIPGITFDPPKKP